ncbi:transposase [Chromobacterium piscinae]|uniref:transposase n=1 Tax=Chromobacterium piscinae TaxID=686831 RepID=UPI0039080F8C
MEIVTITVPHAASRRGKGQPCLDDRAALKGILFFFTFTTGISWERLPQRLGFDSGMTCYRRLRDWQLQFSWDQLYRHCSLNFDSATRLIGTVPV